MIVANGFPVPAVIPYLRQSFLSSSVTIFELLSTLGPLLWQHLHDRPVRLGGVFGDDQESLFRLITLLLLHINLEVGWRRVHPALAAAPEQEAALHAVAPGTVAPEGVRAAVPAEIATPRDVTAQTEQDGKHHAPHQNLPPCVCQHLKDVSEMIFRDSTATVVVIARGDFPADRSQGRRLVRVHGVEAQELRHLGGVLRRCDLCKSQGHSDSYKKQQALGHGRDLYDEASAGRVGRSTTHTPSDEFSPEKMSTDWATEEECDRWAFFFFPPREPLVFVEVITFIPMTVSDYCSSHRWRQACCSPFVSSPRLYWLPTSYFSRPQEDWPERWSISGENAFFCVHYSL